MLIKMIGLDLDGTVLNENGEFSERTKKVFRAAKALGIHIVIATGRAEFSLPKNICEIEEIEYVITSNGARILNLKEDCVVYENFISPDKVKEVLHVLESQNACAEMFADGKAYISKSEYDAVISGEIITRSREYVMATRNPVDDIFGYMISCQDHIENISVNYPNARVKHETEVRLAEIDGITLTSSFPLNNEIGGATTSKADALEFLLKKLNLDSENLMVCGDSQNDIAMIKYAGIGVAMENADENVKSIANLVTLSNDDDGVAHAIEKYVLGI
ncbi:MAG: Cof-type HAD-IIB family hydrolase [Eubacterium sp.]|nr:Cof-type HAD-IIB family hydrolase [Eubacterium sp.]